MKNLKKLVAGLSVAAVAMSFGTAFAAEGTTVGATYSNGKVSLSNLTVDDKQWTVIVINKDKSNATLAAEDLYYINQGSNGDTFWTNGLGTKVDLADGEHDGTYVVRIGKEDTGKVCEAEFTISSTPAGREVTFKYGNINCDTNGALDLTDALAILDYGVAGAQQTFGDFTLGNTYTIKNGEPMKYGNINCDSNGALDLSDALAILDYGVAGAQQTFGDFVLGSTYTAIISE